MRTLYLSEHAPRPAVSPSPEAVRRLTPRRREVLKLMALGYSNARIARELTVTEAAVNRNITLIFDALLLPPDRDAHRRVKAVTAYLMFANNFSDQNQEASGSNAGPKQLAHAGR